MNLKNCPNDNRGGFCSSICPDIGFFQYQVGWFLQNFEIWLTCRVSIYIFSRFLGPTWYQYFEMASTPGYWYFILFMN
jgi:hypothetical protein